MDFVNHAHFKLKIFPFSVKLQIQESISDINNSKTINFEKKLTNKCRTFDQGRTYCQQFLKMQLKSVVLITIFSCVNEK